MISNNMYNDGPSPHSAFSILADLVRATSGHYPPVVALFGIILGHVCFSHIQIAEIPASFVIYVDSWIEQIVGTLYGGILQPRFRPV